MKFANINSLLKIIPASADISSCPASDLRAAPDQQHTDPQVVFIIKLILKLITITVAKCKSICSTIRKIFFSTLFDAHFNIFFDLMLP